MDEERNIYPAKNILKKGRNGSKIPSTNSEMPALKRRLISVSERLEMRRVISEVERRAIST